MKLTVKQVSDSVSFNYTECFDQPYVDVESMTRKLNKILEEMEKPAPVEFTPICGHRHDPFQCNLDPNHEGDHGKLNHYGTGGIWWERKEETPAPTEEDYLGQSFFQRNNPDIRRAEELIAEIKRKRAESPSGWQSYPERATITLKNNGRTFKSISDMQEQALFDLYHAAKADQIRSQSIPEPEFCRPENPCRLCLSKEHS